MADHADDAPELAARGMRGEGRELQALLDQHWRHEYISGGPYSPELATTRMQIHTRCLTAWCLWWLNVH